MCVQKKEPRPRIVLRSPIEHWNWYWNENSSGGKASSPQKTGGSRGFWRIKPLLGNPANRSAARTEGQALSKYEGKLREKLRSSRDQILPPTWQTLEKAESAAPSADPSPFFSEQKSTWANTAIERASILRDARKHLDQGQHPQPFRRITSESSWQIRNQSIQLSPILGKSQDKPEHTIESLIFLFFFFL